jgi:type IV pilus assembly protein PilO
MAFLDNIADQLEQWPFGQKVLLAAAGVILPVLILAYLLVFPRWQELKTLGEDVEREREKLVQIRQTRGQISKFKQELADMEIRFERIKIMLPDSKEIPGLLRIVSQLGLQQGLEFLLFKPEKEIPREFVAEIPVTLHLKGTYHQIGVFFDRLRRLPRIINIKGLEMGGFEEKTGKVTGRCQLITFRVLPLETPGGEKPAGGKKK